MQRQQPSSSNTNKRTYPLISGVDSDDDDECIEEIPVYLNQKHAENTFYFQCPLLHHTKSYDKQLFNNDQQQPSIRMKPNQRRVEFEYPRDGHPSFASRNIANEQCRNPSVVLSSRGVSPKTNYGVGIRMNNGLHITPLDTICRLYPSFQHVDEAELAKRVLEDAQKQQEEKNSAFGNVVVNDDDIKQVQIKVRGKESERSIEYRKKSHAYIKALEDEEKWIALNVHGMTTDASKRIRLSLQCDVQHSNVNFNVKYRDYFAFIHSGIKNETSSANEEFKLKPLNRALYQATNVPPIPIHVRRVLQKAVVISFKRLCQLCNCQSQEDIRETLVAVSKIAWLIQGCWVCKSALLVTESLGGTRDYMILKFARSRIVTREQLIPSSYYLNISIESIDNILKSLAKRVPSEPKEWEFCLETDHKFLSTFESILENEQEKLSLLQADNDVFWRNTTIHLVPEEYGVTDTGELNDRTREQFLLWLKNVIFTTQKNSGTHTVKNLAYIQNRLKKDAINEITWKECLAHVTDDHLQSILNTEFREVPNQSLYCLKSLCNSVADRLRDVIIELYGENDRLRKTDVTKAVAIKLGEDYTLEDGYYLPIMREFGIVSKRSIWTRKVGDDSDIRQSTEISRVKLTRITSK